MFRGLPYNSLIKVATFLSLSFSCVERSSNSMYFFSIFLDNLLQLKQVLGEIRKFTLYGPFS